MWIGDLDCIIVLQSELHWSRVRVRVVRLVWLLRVQALVAVNRRITLWLVMIREREVVLEF